MNVMCSCCGEERPADRVGTLQCHPETSICRGCLDWLRQQAGTVDSTPTLPVLDMRAAITFYESAGFDADAYDEGFAFVEFDDTSVFDLDLNPGIDPATNGAGCFLVVADSDEWHTRLTGAGLPVSELLDMPWGMREFTLTDPFGNRIRIGTASAV